MNDNSYELLGTVHIPEGEVDEFKRNFEMVLNYCGIRKTTQIGLAGKKFEAIEPARFDSTGNIYFDYSIFEKKAYETAGFNVETGEFKISEWGYKEYAFGVHIMKIFCQACSDKPCYMTQKGKPVNIEPFLWIFNKIFDREFPCRNGFDVWEMFSFFHYDHACEDITGMEAWKANPAKYKVIGLGQLPLALTLDETEMKLREESLPMTKNKISESHSWLQEEFLYRILYKHREDGAYECWLKKLLLLSVAERQQLAGRDDDFGIVAEISLYLHAPTIVKIYSLVQAEDFWTVWERLGGRGYKDIIQKRKEEQAEEFEKASIYRAMSRENENEFLFFWNGENLKLSEELIEQIEDWKKEYDGMTLPDKFDMENELAQILIEMRDVWRCPSPEKSVIDDFLSNRTEESYQRLILILRHFLDMGTEMFPELTGRQAVDWVLRRIRDKDEVVEMAAFLTLMGNFSQRRRIFGV